MARFYIYPFPPRNGLRNHHLCLCVRYTTDQSDISFYTCQCQCQCLRPSPFMVPICVIRRYPLVALQSWFFLRCLFNKKCKLIVMSWMTHVLYSHWFSLIIRVYTRLSEITHFFHICWFFGALFNEHLFIGPLVIHMASYSNVHTSSLSSFSFVSQFLTLIRQLYIQNIHIPLI